MSELPKDEDKENNVEKNQKPIVFSKAKELEKKEKEFYFIIFYQRPQIENSCDFVFEKDKDTMSPPKIIFEKVIDTNNNKFNYKKVLKYKNDGTEKKKNFYFL